MNIESVECMLAHSKIEMTYESKTTHESEKNENECEHRDFEHTNLLFSSWQIFAPEYLYINLIYASSSPIEEESYAFDH